MLANCIHYLRIASPQNLVHDEQQQQQLNSQRKDEEGNLHRKLNKRDEEKEKKENILIESGTNNELSSLLFTKYTVKHTHKKTETMAFVYRISKERERGVSLGVELSV